MAKSAFTQIKEAEAQAQALVKSAAEEAALMIRRAEEETAEMLLRSEKEYGDLAEERISRTKAGLEEDSASFSKETGELCEALRQKLLLKKSDAVEALIQIISA